MILQSLCDYYQRKNAQQPGSLAPPGFEPKGIPFIILLTPDGTFAGLEDTRTQQGKRQVPRTFLVPKAPPRSGAKAYAVVNPLWDHYGYLLAQPKLDKPDLPPTEKAITLAQNQHQTFSDFLADLQQQLADEPGLKAIVRFNADASQRQAVTEHASWPDVLKINGCNLSFRLVGETDLICQSKPLQDFFGQQALTTGDNSPEGVCLVTGKATAIARLHSGISGVNAKPAPFAASNLAAFESYGKSQGFNFPVSNTAVFEYTTALNHLLRQDSPNKFRLGETVTVCWAEKQDQLETVLPLLFSDPPKDDDNPDARVEAITGLLSSIHNGAYHQSDQPERFYVLGLAPNSARIMVRLWQVCTVAELATRIAQYFDDLDLTGRERFGYPSLYQLLTACVIQGKADNIPPNLIADTARQILAGLPLPATLLQLALRRIRAEPSCPASIEYRRITLLKACFNRTVRARNGASSRHEELTMSLNPEDTRPGYRLGRLFAVLEKVQQEASGGQLNSTIKDRYYGAASSTPVTAFTSLIKLSHAHQAKLTPGRRVNIEKLLMEIFSALDEFPAQLDLEQQSLFAVGYYHQRQALFTKQNDDSQTETDTAIAEEAH